MYDTRYRDHQPDDRTRTQPLAGPGSYPLDCLQRDSSIAADLTGNDTTTVLVSDMLTEKFFGPGEAIGVLSRTPQGMITTLINPPVSAALVAIFFLFGFRLSGDLKRSIKVTVILGCCTIVWPYSQSFWTQPISSLCLFSSLYLLYAGNGKRFVLPAGLLLGYAVLTRYETVIFLPFYIYYLFTLRSVKRWDSYRSALEFIIGFGLMIMLLGAWNIYRFGSLTDTGAGHQRMPSFTWSGNLLQSIPSNLIGPNRSLFLYSPPLVLGVIGFASFIRKRKFLAWTIAAASAAAFLVYCKFSLWPAGASWGPRFLVILTPFLLLPAFLMKFEEGWKRVLAGILVPMGLVVQLIAVAIPLQISYIGYFWGRLGISSRMLLRTDIVPQFIKIFSTSPDFWWTRGPVPALLGLVLFSLLIITGRKVLRYARTG